MTKIDNIVTLCPNLLNDFQETTDLEQCVINDIVTLTNHLFTFESDQEQLAVETFALRYDCLMSNLNCPFDDDNEIIKNIVDESDKCDASELDKSVLIAFIKKSLYRGMYLRNVVLGPKRCHPGEEEEVTTWCNRVLSDSTMLEEFIKILHDCVVMETLHEGYAFVSIVYYMIKIKY